MLKRQQPDVNETEPSSSLSAEEYISTDDE